MTDIKFTPRSFEMTDKEGEKSTQYGAVEIRINDAEMLRLYARRSIKHGGKLTLCHGAITVIFTEISPKRGRT